MIYFKWTVLVPERRGWVGRDCRGWVGGGLRVRGLGGTRVIEREHGVVGFVGERGQRGRTRERESGRAREREATTHKHWLRERGGLRRISGAGFRVSGFRVSD